VVLYYKLCGDFTIEDLTKTVTSAMMDDVQLASKVQGTLQLVQIIMEKLSESSSWYQAVEDVMTWCYHNLTDSTSDRYQLASRPRSRRPVYQPRAL
jgi:hypothetical protein